MHADGGASREAVDVRREHVAVVGRIVDIVVDGEVRAGLLLQREPQELPARAEVTDVLRADDPDSLVVRIGRDRVEPIEEEPELLDLRKDRRDRARGGLRARGHGGHAGHTRQAQRTGMVSFV